MCGGVRYHFNGREQTVYFPQPNAMLPVRRRDGSVSLVTWGRREGEEGRLPQTGWARLDSLKAGKWDRFFPKPVLIVVDQYMEKDKQGKSHWFTNITGNYIQGCLVREGDEQRVYVVTITPTIPEILAIHDRFPKIVQKISKMPV